jgi:anti-anti-sigma factor
VTPLRAERQGHVTVLVPEGDLDVAALPAWEAQVDALLAAGVRALVWDLSGVGLLPSTAAGLLLQTAARVRAAGGRMALAGAPPRVRATLGTMGVLDVFPLYPGRAAALAALA